ncbi:MAG: ribosomal protein small subunit ribosomal protein [Candidatus Parcubacteria bacterium]|jgi:small subunit ribosomal protein S5
MTAKEIKTNNEVNDVAIPATGVDVAEIVATGEVVSEVAQETATTESAPVVANKVTPGRKMRGDSARRGGSSGPQGRGARGGSRSNEPRERVKPEFDSKIIDIRRVTRVTSGGRRMNFSVAVVAGDHKGRVGVGLGKSIDTASAVEKATREAKKNLIKVPLSAQMTIPHAVEAKFASARIMIFPARGRGIVAGSSARAVIELAGIRDVCAKFLSGSKNRLNNAKVAIEALKKLSKVSRAVLTNKPTKPVENSKVERLVNTQ